MAPKKDSKSFAAAVRRELPACAYGLWITVIWLAFAVISGATVMGPTIATLYSGGYLPLASGLAFDIAIVVSLVVLAILGGATSTMVAQMLTPGRAPSGAKGVLVVVMAAWIAVIIPALPLLSFMSPKHVMSVAAMTFGLRLVVDAVATEAWSMLVSGRPKLGPLYRVVDEQTPVGAVGWSVILGHGALVSFPLLVVSLWFVWACFSPMPGA